MGAVCKDTRPIKVQGTYSLENGLWDRGEQTGRVTEGERRVFPINVLYSSLSLLPAKHRPLNYRCTCPRLTARIIQTNPAYSFSVATLSLFVIKHCFFFLNLTGFIVMAMKADAAWTCCCIPSSTAQSPLVNPGELNPWCCWIQLCSDLSHLLSMNAKDITASIIEKKNKSGSWGCLDVMCNTFLNTVLYLLYFTMWTTSFSWCMFC